MKKADVSESTRIEVPAFLYGTAWKEEATERLTKQALEAGFLGIDTANQRKHYDEVSVGRGIQAFCEERSFPREKLFLQTKFTYKEGKTKGNKNAYDAMPISKTP